MIELSTNNVMTDNTD